MTASARILPFFVAAGLWCAQTVRAQPSFVIPLTVSDSSSTQSVHFGVHPLAQACIDTADNFLGWREAELPPLPPEGVFDVRLVDPHGFSACFGQGSLVDYRPSFLGVQLDTFQVRFQVGNNGRYPVMVSWPAGLSANAVTLRLIDQFGGVQLNVDMLNTTSIAISNPFLTSFLIVLQPRVPLPEFTASTATLDFGDVVVGAAVADSIIVTNTGTAPLGIISVASTHTDFVPQPVVVDSLAPLESRSYRIVFTPSFIGDRIGRVVFVHNALTSPDSIGVRGRGIDGGTLQADPVVDFGTVVVGEIVDRTVTLTNTGIVPLTLFPPVLAFGADSGFSILTQPSTMTLAPAESTTFAVRFQPQFPSYAVFSGLVWINSTAGSASVRLTGVCPDTIPPTVAVTFPSGGEVFLAGTQIHVLFSGADNDQLTGFAISYSTDGGVSFPYELARTAGNVTAIPWNIPDFLQTSQARIRVVARDRSGNEASATTGLFSVQLPPVTANPIRIVVTFDPPPAGQIAPPQNVRATAVELTGGGGQLPGGGLLPPPPGGPHVLGYNIYRVPMPPDSIPPPSAEDIVGDPANLVGSVAADSVEFDDVVASTRGYRFIYSLTSFYDNGTESHGSPPATSTYLTALVDSAHGWWGPLDNVNAPWYPYPSIDAAKLLVTLDVPPGSSDSNRSVLFNVRNRGTNFASFMKAYGPIPRPVALTGIEVHLKVVTSSPILTFYFDLVYNGQSYEPSLAPRNATEIRSQSWQTITVPVGTVPAVDYADTIIFGIASYGDSAKVFVDYMKFVGPGGYIFDTMGDNPGASRFLTITPDTMALKDLSKGRFVKPVKRKKRLFPNWANLLEETVVQGGFQPLATESDDAGGMRVGIAHMIRLSPDPLNPKWRPFKDSALVRAWVRLSKWDFKKNIGKTFGNLQKTLEDKAVRHTGPPRGLDSTNLIGDLKRKKLIRQFTKLSPRKHNNGLFAELVALKMNIAASQLGKTRRGFGELQCEMPGNHVDGLEIVEISRRADSALTYWQGRSPAYYDSLYAAIHRINRAFLGPIDTISFEAGAKLRLEGAVELDDVPFLKPGLTPPRVLVPTTDQTEDMFDFDDDEFDDEDENPTTARLYQNFPNPFNPVTSLPFRLRVPAIVTVKLYNILGQHVATVLNGEDLDEGYHVVEFSGAWLASGVYFYQIHAVDPEGEVQTSLHTRKMLLLK